MRPLACAAFMFALPLTSGTLRDVEYGRVNNISLRMDVRTPPGPGPHPAAILVHGGGWMRGDRVWNVEPLFAPLTQAGVASFSISYRLATDFLQIGTAVEDVRAAIRHVRENAAKYGVDPRRIALIGESAGAHLAAMAALEDSKSVAAVVSLYGPTDLELLARTSTVVPDQIRKAVEGSALAELLAAHLRSLSPVRYIKSGAPPFLLMHGTADGIVPIEQSTAMRDRLRAAGADAEMVAIQGGGHGMRYWRDNWQARMTEWLRRKLAV
jgi:acetyl esterase